MQLEPLLALPGWIVEKAITQIVSEQIMVEDQEWAASQVVSRHGKELSTLNKVRDVHS